jgi:mono/diheme cytochrome c family protein
VAAGSAPSCRVAGSSTSTPDAEDEIAVVTDGEGSMPSFDGRLSGDEIRQVVEYTRTL